MRVEVAVLEDPQLREIVKSHLKATYEWEDVIDMWLDLDGPHREALKMKIMVKVLTGTPYNEFQIARCNFGKFIDHCGIASVQGIFAHEPLRQIWMDLIEDLLYQNQYSAIIAADTEGGTWKFITTYGKHWRTVSKENWVNKRMGPKHPMRILIRYLNEDPPKRMARLDRS